MSTPRESVRFVDAVKIRPGVGAAHLARGVPVEAPLAIEVNGQIIAHVMRTPGNDIELALGFCVTEGILSGMADVESVRLCPDDAGKVTVRTTHPVPDREPVHLTSACAGRGLDDPNALPEPLADNGLLVAPEALFGAANRLREGQAIRQAVGAAHAAALIEPTGRVLVVREDVGRHNAIDKAAGLHVYEGGDLGDVILMSTGRASSEMVLKAARAGIQVAASRSGTTSLGAELAERLGVTLICYVRSAELTVVTHPERVIGARIGPPSA